MSERDDILQEVLDELNAHLDEHREAFRGRFGVNAEVPGLTVAIEIVENMRSRRRRK